MNNKKGARRVKVSTKGRYALRLMIDMSLHNTGDYVLLKEISERQQISIKYLEQIVGHLCRAGYLKSLRGPKGGYKLTRPPSEYTVGDLLRVTEGNIVPVSCLETQPNDCARYGKCAAVEFWQGLQAVINEYVDATTIEDLAQKQLRLSPGEYACASRQKNSKVMNV